MALKSPKLWSGTPLNRMGPRIFVSIALLTCLTVLTVSYQSLSTLEDILFQYQEEAFQQRNEVLSAALNTKVNELRSLAEYKFAERRRSAPDADPAQLSEALTADLRAADPHVLEAVVVNVNAAAEPPKKLVSSPTPSAAANETSEAWIYGCTDAHATDKRPACPNPPSLMIRAATASARKKDAAAPRLVELAVYLADDTPSNARSAGELWLVIRASQELFSTLFDARDGSATSLFDAAGNRLTPRPQLDDQDLGMAITQKQIRGFLKAGLLRDLLTYADDSGLAAVTTLRHLRDTGNIVQAISAKPASTFKRLFDLRRNLALSGALFTLIAMLLAFELARRIAAPLEKVTKMTRSISQGAFNIRVNVRGVEEVVSLGTSVNEMADNIKRLMLEQREAGRMAAELDTARLVQEMMFPPPTTLLPALKIHAFSLPASECGGDLWGLLPLSGGRTLVYIADATGHGLSSAFMTVTARTAFGVALATLEASLPGMHEPTSGAMLELINKAVYDTGRGQILMTMFLAIVDPDRREIRYANAGHHFPLRLRVADAAEGAAPANIRSLSAGGPVLGFAAGGEQAHWSEAVEPYDHGDKLVLFTDGILENRNLSGEHFGRRRMRKQLAQLAAQDGAAVCDGFRQAYQTFEGGSSPEDDSTFVVVDLCGRAPSDVDEMTLAGALPLNDDDAAEIELDHADAA